jgi:putative heme-binding domain-containing protein
MAANDPSPAVRRQLACSAKRLPAGLGLAIVSSLLERKEDLTDPHIPLLCWWAIEANTISSRDLVMRYFGQPPAWKSPLFRPFIAERLARRYMAEGTPEGYAACNQLLVSADAKDYGLLIRGMDSALEGRRLSAVPGQLDVVFSRIWHADTTDPLVIRFVTRLGSDSAYNRALTLVGDAAVPDPTRLQMIELLGQIARPDAAGVLLKLLAAAKSDAVRAGVLTALQSFPDPSVTDATVSLYPTASAGVRGKILALLVGRLPSAKRLVAEVEAGRVKPADVPFDQVRQMRLFNDESLNKSLEKHWGKISPATAGEKTARIVSLGSIIRAGHGDPVTGHALFAKNCGNCHTLFGEGNKVGPELTGADRKNRDFLITQIVDPSAVIRQEYVAYQVVTTDGRSLTGLIAEQSPQTVTLVDEKNIRTVIPRAKIDELIASPVSLMPEKILDPLEDQQIRDLFAYLQSDTPPKPAPANDKKDGKLVVCLVSGSLEYKSDESLAEFQKYLEANFPVTCTRAFRKADNDLPGLENLDTCDVAVFFTRRLTIQGEQLERVKKYCQSGKPIVAIRTASHGFQNWLAMDKEVLGGNYQNHYGAGPKCEIAVAEKGKDHPVLAGVKPYASESHLYRNTGLAADNEILLTGAIPDHSEPIAWTRMNKGGRVFYTSLGSPSDFQNENFIRMLTNAIFWTAKREVPKSGDSLNLTLRSRKLEIAPDDRRDWKTHTKEEAWPAKETAIIVCDMWDKHWSKGATIRVGEIAPRMNEVLKAARARGVTIVHAPSDTMAFYADNPARKRVLAAPAVKLPAEILRKTPQLPIDDSDGGSDTGEKPWFKAWSRQHPAIEIDTDKDGVSENGQEIWNFLQQRGVKRVLIMGVHTNMCVLNRTFGIKQWEQRSVPVALVRDLTDTMYNPERSPFVTHDDGTRLVIEFIEKYWCPSVASADIMGKR